LFFASRMAIAGSVAPGRAESRPGRSRQPDLNRRPTVQEGRPRARSAVVGGLQLASGTRLPFSADRNRASILKSVDRSRVPRWLHFTDVHLAKAKVAGSNPVFRSKSFRARQSTLFKASGKRGRHLRCREYLRRRRPASP